MRLLRNSLLLSAALTLGTAALRVAPVQAATKTAAKSDFRTSDRCVACHNNLKTKAGEDVSIGFQWRASVMANSGRDPYWQGSVRREALDHPAASREIQDECSVCHIPIVHLEDRDTGKQTDVFGLLPLAAKHDRAAEAADGVSCSVCHQVSAKGLGSPETYNGNVVIDPPNAKQHHPENGPFRVDQPHQTIMITSTAGFVPTQAAHIRDSALCGTCHTLYTTARDEAGKPIGKLPEQTPYQEWQHSDFAKGETCQSCHMPQVNEPTRVASVFGPDDRDGLHRHVFVGGNILLLRILADHRSDLDVKAQPEELNASFDRTREFLKTRSAKVTIESLDHGPGKLDFTVHTENLTGHKLPTAFPSRRAWLHVTVRDQGGRIVFESGHLNPDGSIVGNDNDENPARFEPHYTEVTKPDQVEIYEDIMEDTHGHVTTGLITATDYIKDNRLLPHGFDKATAEHDIRVIGSAADDPNFTGNGSLVRYVVDTGSAQGPFHVEAELWYQPAGYRWAHNFAPYKASEPQRFLNYFESASRDSAQVLATAEATR